MTVVGVMTVGMLVIGGTFAVVGSFALGGLLLIAADVEDFMQRMPFPGHSYWYRSLWLT